VRALLISTYDLGRQPFGLASPAAWLQRAGIAVCMRDLSREALDEDQVRDATLIAFYLPMHTATRLAVPVIRRVRSLNPSATVAAYGLYAPLSESLLRENGVSVVIGPEAEELLVNLATGPTAGPATDTGGVGAANIPRLTFITPQRQGLPGLERYATLQMPDGTRRIAGSTDATRGCKHRCRHCPIVPIYDGQFRVVPMDVVLTDIAQQVAGGAEHITFGDPDFFNGPTHARRIVEELHARHPHVTYDVTIKIEHLLRHAQLLRVLARTGCLFITSAVEAVDDRILVKLEKGHTRADFAAAAGLCHDAGVPLAPTFVAFTPWTTVDGYRDLLDTIDNLGLVEHVAPVQWGLRLLVTQGSRLLELEDVRARIGPFDNNTLTYPWTHDDPRVDALQADVVRLVGVRLTHERRQLFDAVRQMAGLKPGPCPNAEDDLVARSTIPYLNEPWYC
jgi:radical SAM superfamily enzyme YgiQ (UPF0313 family)